MSKHTITITLVIEVPDGPRHRANVEAMDRATEDLLDDGALVDWICDAAADRDGADLDDVTSVDASHTIEPTTGP